MFTDEDLGRRLHAYMEREDRPVAAGRRRARAVAKRPAPPPPPAHDRGSCRLAPRDRGGDDRRRRGSPRRQRRLGSARQPRRDRRPAGIRQRVGRVLRARQHEAGRVVRRRRRRGPPGRLVVGAGRLLRERAGWRWPAGRAESRTADRRERRRAVRRPRLAEPGAVDRRVVAVVRYLPAAPDSRPAGRGIGLGRESCRRARGRDGRVPGHQGWSAGPSARERHPHPAAARRRQRRARFARDPCGARRRRPRRRTRDRTVTRPFRAHTPVAARRMGRRRAANRPPGSTPVRRALPASRSPRCRPASTSSAVPSRREPRSTGGSSSARPRRHRRESSRVASRSALGATRSHSHRRRAPRGRRSSARTRTTFTMLVGPTNGFGWMRVVIRGPAGKALDAAVGGIVPQPGIFTGSVGTPNGQLRYACAPR